MQSEITLLGLVAAARELGMSSGHLRTLADQGQLPMLRDAARRRMFLSSDVSAFKQKREQAKNGGRKKVKLLVRG